MNKIVDFNGSKLLAWSENKSFQQIKCYVEFWVYKIKKNATSYNPHLKSFIRVGLKTLNMYSQQGNKRIYLVGRFF